MPAMRALRAGGALALMLLAGCAGPRVLEGGGQSIAQAQAEAATGGRLRVAVGVVIDRSQGKLASELALLNATRPPEQQMPPDGVTAGVRDMLTTALFGSARFIVIERDALNLALSEQEFSQSARAGDKTRIPLGQLEGADILVLGALTGFDAGASGGALPIPLPLGNNGDFGVLNVRAKRGYVAMDLRVVEVKTGRVLASNAVEGRNWRLGLDFTGFFSIGNSRIKLPGLLKYFSNTPVEEALQKMVSAAVDEIAKKAGPQ